MSKQDLKDKVAVITGGSTEIAGALAVALANEGVKTCLCGKQNDLLEIAALKARANGGECITVVSELESLETAQAVLDSTLAVFGRVDILIIVSPFWAGGQIHEHAVKTWDLVMDANIREAFVISRTVLPIFRAQQHGEILSIGSDSALGIYEQDGAYGVAMHAMVALMELIRVENREHGIRTHILAPGVASTSELDSAGLPCLSVTDVVDWAIWLLTRPAHLRGNGSILI